MILDPSIDLFESLRQKDHFHYFANIMQQTGNEQLLYLVVTQIIADDFGAYGATQGMVPELFLSDQAGLSAIGEQVEHRGGQEQITDGIKAQQDDRTGDRRYSLRKSIKRRVDQLQKPGCQHLVIGDDPCQITGRGFGVVYELRNPQYRSRECRQIIYPGNDSIKVRCAHFPCPG